MWMTFHRLVLGCQCEALSLQHPHTNGRVFLNTGVMASHRDCKAYGRGRWWLISGICSNSDSWHPTSPPLIRAACGVMDITRPVSEGEGFTGEMSHTPTRASPKPQTSSVCKKELLSLQVGSENKHALQKNNCAPCIRCALIPSQDINRSAQLHNRLTQLKGNLSH